MMKTKTELQKKLASLLRKVTELETQIKETPDDPVGCMTMVEKPSIGKTYYYMARNGVVCRHKWVNNEFNNGHFVSGNCFETEEIAELAVQRKQLQFREYQAAVESWEGEEIDWNNDEQEKWCAFYCFFPRSVGLSKCYQSRHSDSYFKTKESLKVFIDSLTEDEQRLLWAGE